MEIVKFKFSDDEQLVKKTNEADMGNNIFAIVHKPGDERPWTAFYAVSYGTNWAKAKEILESD